MILHTSKTFASRVKASIPRIEAATLDSPAAAMAYLLLLRAVPVELPRLRGLTLALPPSSSVALEEEEEEEEEVEEEEGRTDATTASKDGKDSTSDSSSSPGSNGSGSHKINITSATTKTDGGTTITTITTTTTVSDDCSSSSSSSSSPTTTSIDPPQSYRHHYLTSAVVTLIGQGKMRGLRKLALENVYFPFTGLNPYGKTMHSLKHALGTGRHLTCLRKLVLSGCVISSAEDRESLAEVLVKESGRTLPHLRVLKCVGGLGRASVAAGGGSSSSSSNNNNKTAATTTATAAKTKTKKERAEEEEASVAGAIAAFLPVLLDALRRGACPTLRRLVLEGHRWEKETMEGLRAAMVAREGGMEGKVAGAGECEDGGVDGGDKGEEIESEEKGIEGEDARKMNDKIEKEVTAGEMEGGTMTAPRLQAMPANVKIEPLQELSLRDCSFAYYAFEVVCEMVGDTLFLPQWRLLDLRGAEERFVTKEALDGWLEARRRGGGMREELGQDEEVTGGWEGEDEDALLLNDVRVDFQW